MSRARRRIVKNQIDIELEQISTVPEHLFLDGSAVLGEEIQGPVELVETEILGVWQPNPIAPALIAGEFRAWPLQSLQGHGQQRGLEGQFGLARRSVLLDRRPDAELIPQGLGDMDDTEFLNALDLDISDLNGLALGHDLLDAVIHEDPPDALHQTPKCCLVELVGAPEAMHHLGFGSLRVGIPSILGECIVPDGRAVSVLAFCTLHDRIEKQV